MAKTDLSRAAIVDRALDLADAEGLDAVTVRRLGQEFGVTPMALYWHVKNKDELLDAMGDRIFETVEYEADDSAAWDVQLRSVVSGLVAAFRKHPACLDLLFRRVLACPDGQRLSEHTLGLLRRAGFTTRQTADLGTHAMQTALMLVASEPGAEPGVADEDVVAMLDEKRAGLDKLPAEQFPYIREMAPDLLHCDDIDGYYDFGVDLFVSGVQQLHAGLRPKRRRAQSRA